MSSSNILWEIKVFVLGANIFLQTESKQSNLAYDIRDGLHFKRNGLKESIILKSDDEVVLWVRSDSRVMGMLIVAVVPWVNGDDEKNNFFFVN